MAEKGLKVLNKANNFIFLLKKFGRLNLFA